MSGTQPTEATRWQRWRYRYGVGPWIKRLLRRITDVGIVRPFTKDDLVTGQHIEIRVSAAYTIFAVDGRDYYFDRFTGKFDGTGMAIGCGTSPSSHCSSCQGQPA